MRHVFVETNWVVAYVTPAYLQSPVEIQLAESAKQDEIRIYVPAICLTEARRPVQTKFQPKPIASVIRRYVRWAIAAGKLEAEAADITRRVLDQYQAGVSAELQELDERLSLLVHQSGIEVFALNEAMLTRAVDLSVLNLDLKPFDQAILAAVLVKAEELREQGATDIVFCELDSDLQPWNRDGSMKQSLKQLYDAAGIWVFGDFAMSAPSRPA